jgi:hypothetical protein
MDAQEFDERYEGRMIATEITLLQVFRDLDFYKVKANMFKSVHKKADITGTVGSLGQIVRDCSDCETFGELSSAHPERYSGIRENLLLCINKFYYHP